MEMLNNIWIALSTENAELVNFLLIPCSFIENIMILMLFINLLNIKSSKKQKILYITLSSIGTLINNVFVPSPFYLALNYILLFALIYVIFKQGILKSIVCLVFSMITFTLVSLLVVNVYIKFLNISFELVESVPLYRLFYLGIIYVTLCLIIFILKYKNFKIKILEDFDKSTKSTLIINFALGLLTIIVQAILVAYYINFVPIYVTFLSFIVMLAYFGISLYSLSKVTKLTTTTRELRTAEEYNRSITVLYDDVKGFKHDFNNIVSSIGGYIDTNDMEGLKEYFLPLREDCQRTNNIAMLNPNIINNPAIYSLLSSKYHKADGLGIKINFEFFVDLNEFEINSYEFSRILGILLDNAIEAASECKKKVINICFRNEFNKNRHIVLISNTYKDKNVDIEKIFEKSKSSKENHSGLGLWEVRQYVKKHNNLNLFISKASEIQNDHLIEVFPDIVEKTKHEEVGMEYLLKLTEDINVTNERKNKRMEKIFVAYQK